ncbi:uncharacterized protein BP5553_04575 [Venustampulla echinocandica]|uniref:Uncharacterized protein n=1 Tax=Venustampulla echinocandica TaxID=2656787 RepID=A0A370TNN2_9HELO|nr:uncharacterized protein BP5553_04575 [Venustampulla echinocandica]RDL37142.1 hypothetical protein BP5553_04575 [Venustampulla echinocandica]
MFLQKLLYIGGLSAILEASLVEGYSLTEHPVPTRVKRIPAEASSSASPVTALTGCHMHGTVQYCMAGTEEYQLLTTPTATGALPAQYTGCHSHSSDLWCFDPDGNESQFAVEGASTDTTEQQASGTVTGVQASSTSSGENCHFHAGVEHCVGEGQSESGTEGSCDRKGREYNVKLRIGLLFVILVTSFLGVSIPIFITSFSSFSSENIVFVALKQFGTGVIISTAFIHLFTHAFLMFSNSCLGTLEYESTTAAIFLGGLFISFLVEYLGHRLAHWRKAQVSSGLLESDSSDPKAQPAPGEASDDTDIRPSCPHEPTTLRKHHHRMGSETVSVLVLESGIIFHSILIGLTLVVAGDSFFITLFIVILFHQVFEGIALGTCIAALPSTAAQSQATGASPASKPVSFTTKLAMAITYALTTPLGMAIGIGVLGRFNGNDPSTIIAIGTLDALSAGILAWVGLVEMWAGDWLHGGLMDAKPLRTGIAMIALIAGLVVMSVLGKWA